MADSLGCSFVCSKPMGEHKFSRYASFLQLPSPHPSSRQPRATRNVIGTDLNNSKGKARKLVHYVLSAWGQLRGTDLNNSKGKARKLVHYRSIFSHAYLITKESNCAQYASSCLSYAYSKSFPNLWCMIFGQEILNNAGASFPTWSGGTKAF